MTIISVFTLATLDPARASATRRRSDRVMHAVQHLTTCVLLLGLLAWTTPAQAADAGSGEMKFLVARPELQDAVYGAAILVARTLPNGSTVGVILNKPTPVTVGDLFPEHRATLNTEEFVYFGGPMNLNVLFALVESDQSPGAESMRIAPNLYLVVDRAGVEKIIEGGAEHARFVAGMVVWGPGELKAEMKRGLWYEIEGDAGQVLGRHDGLWEEMVHQVEVIAKFI